MCNFRALYGRGGEPVVVCWGVDHVRVRRACRFHHLSATAACGLRRAVVASSCRQGLSGCVRALRCCTEEQKRHKGDPLAPVQSKQSITCVSTFCGVFCFFEKVALGPCLAAPGPCFAAPRRSKRQKGDPLAPVRPKHPYDVCKHFLTLSS